MVSERADGEADMGEAGMASNVCACVHRHGRRLQCATYMPRFFMSSATSSSAPMPASPMAFSKPPKSEWGAPGPHNPNLSMYAMLPSEDAPVAEQ